MNAPSMFVRSHYARLYALLDDRRPTLGATPIQELITGSPGTLTNRKACAHLHSFFRVSVDEKVLASHGI
jgi:hypothetical protein